MTKFHLLYHIFKYLEENYLLQDMLDNFPEEKWNDTATSTIKASLLERYEAYKK